jgi:type VI secretion system protein VasG
VRVEPRLLARRLTPTASRMLEAAIGRSATGQHYEVTVEHMLQQMLDPEDGDAAAIFLHLNKNRIPLKNRVDKILQHMRTGNTSRPTFSANLWNWIEEAWLHASLELGDQRVRSGILLYTLIRSPGRYTGEEFPELEEISADELKSELGDALSVTKEAVEAAPVDTPSGQSGAAGTPGAARPGGEDSALGRFCTNLTAEVRAGRLDPIFGRHREIRQCVDILSRRRKNNPIIVGEPGVGKTALAEGLAHAIVAGDVPKHLQNNELMALDLGALQAGASVKGEFENRLKAVISEVKSSAKPVILFIDEAHVIIGAGGQKGGGDAANLLKPALARGELRTVAATTFAEYKKYFEKDAALERRFQPVKVDEPDDENAIVMLRGLKQLYENAHGVDITDEAVVAAVTLSSRYIAGRLLPDKAVDLLDTTAARVRVGLNAKPEELIDLEARIAAAERATTAIQRDIEQGDASRQEEFEEALALLEELKGEHVGLKARWLRQRKKAHETLTARYRARLAPLEEELEKLGDAPEHASEKADLEKEIARIKKQLLMVGDAEESSGEEAAAPEGDAPAAEAPPVEAPAEEASAAEDEDEDDGEALLNLEVNGEAVARTVSAWTGIPLGKMQKDSIGTVLRLDEKLQERVKGQDHAMAAVAEAMQMSFAEVRNPEAPVGVFLFVGPSGVGKTETALALADELYGGERFVTQINMSEYQEKHTVSRLIGSPPGYVGYGEGGVLTEAVRQRPYSVVLLDECEKADPDVLNLFYQTFDKGMMNDGEGREINFRNTVIILTSNLATDEIVEAYSGEEKPHYKDVVADIRPILSKWFKPALLARMTVIPYGPIDADTMRLIASLKLNRLRKTIRASHGIETTFSEELIEELARRCTESETGARNVDHILRSTLTPMVATGILELMVDDREPGHVAVSLAPSGDFRVDVDPKEM